MFYHRSTAGFLSSMLLMCFCWILSEITWKCCAVFPLLQKEMANLWHLSWVPLQLFFFAKVAIMPSTRAGEWPASLDLERTHVSCRCVRQGRASGEQLAPLSLWPAAPSWALLYAGQALGVLNRKILICSLCSQRLVLWDYRNLYFF